MSLVCRAAVYMTCFILCQAFVEQVYIVQINLQNL